MYISILKVYTRNIFITTFYHRNRYKELNYVCDCRSKLFL